MRHVRDAHPQLNRGHSLKTIIFYPDSWTQQISDFLMRYVNWRFTHLLVIFKPPDSGI